MNINIKCNDKIVERTACDNLLAAITDCTRKSKISTQSGSIEIVVNPDMSEYDHYEQITTKIFCVEKGKINWDESVLAIFKFNCIGLHPSLFKDIDRIMMVFVPADDSNARSNDTEPKAENKSDDDDDEVRSYKAVKPIYTLDKVILSNATKLQIDRAISLVEQHDKIFNEWGYSEIDPYTKTILCFYGAPGTGKTMCAHAIASKLGKNILIASYASIESKWVGEGPKNLQRIFTDAIEQDAVLFFDEADSFLSKRVNNAETGSDKHYNRMSNEMFQLLESFNGIVIFATNMVTDFDKAFKSRILAFIEFVVPDHDTRKKLINIMIPKKLPMTRPLTDEELDVLADISEGFSGREIRKAILTTFAEGATTGVEVFSLEQFKVGFNSVKEETISVNENAALENGIIADFFEYNTTNGYIMDVCMYAAWQGGKIDGTQTEYLINLSKILGCEKPDFSISYLNKDIDDAVVDIRTNARSKECLKYCTEILAMEDSHEQQRNEILIVLCDRLNCSDDYPLFKDLMSVYGLLYNASPRVHQG